MTTRRDFLVGAAAGALAASCGSAVQSVAGAGVTAGPSVAPAATGPLSWEATRALFKLRALLSGSLRLRSACDLAPLSETVTATAPAGFDLPSADDLSTALVAAVAECKPLMTVSTAVFGDKLHAKEAAGADQPAGEASETEGTGV